MSWETLQTATKAIRAFLPEDFVPTLGVILGSGLSHLGDHITEVAAIPYAKIPGFYVSTVQGHEGRLLAGFLEGVPVLCLKGRVHFYEGTPIQSMQTMIRVLKQLGCQSLLITNAAGSLRAEVLPGRLMMITDHINFQGVNPLVGLNDDRIGPRFVPMDNAYDLELRQRFQSVAQKAGIELAEGTYFGVLGSCFETPAEIRAFRLLGGDAIGMSTVPEVILARHCGLKVLAISVITNLAAGMTDQSLSHTETLYYAEKASETLISLVKSFAREM